LFDPGSVTGSAFANFKIANHISFIGIFC
jgi:hypothetical protein